MTTDPTDHPQGDAALLIDWENIKYSLQNKGHRVSISALREAAEKQGRLVVARAYADWQEHGEDQNNLYVAGIEPIYVPVRKYMEMSGEERRRNSVDVKLTADCIELSHRFPAISTYILVSGDQDFLHVVNTLRPYGKRTVMIGVSWTTSARLAEQVDEMIYYDREVDPIQIQEESLLRDAASAAPAAVLAEAVSLAPELFTALGVETGDRALMVHLARAIIEVLYEYRTKGQPLLLSQLGLEVGKRAPRAFSLYGRGRLTPIVSVMSNKGLLQLVDRRNVYWLFLPEEDIPAETEPEATEGSAGQTATPWAGWGGPGPSVHGYDDLPDADKTRVLTCLRDLGRELQFASFNKIRETVNALPGSAEWDVTRLINSALDRGILKHGEERKWMDYSTGREVPFHTFVLNWENDEVKTRLA